MEGLVQGWVVLEVMVPKVEVEVAVGSLGQCYGGRDSVTPWLERENEVRNVSTSSSGVFVWSIQRWKLVIKQYSNQMKETSRVSPGSTEPPP